MLNAFLSGGAIGAGFAGVVCVFLCVFSSVRRFGGEGLGV